MSGGLDRRNFIKAGFLTALPSILGLPSHLLAKTPTTYLVGAHTDQVAHPDAVNITADDVSGHIHLLDLNTNQLSRYPLPTYVHVFERHPTVATVVVGAGRWVPSAIIFDIEKARILKVLKAPTKHVFVGHVCFDKDGKRAFFPTYSHEQRAGKICVFDVAAWSLIGLVDSGGARPHECLMLGDELCVVNFLEKNDSTNGAVTVLNSETLKVVRSFPTPSCSHLLLLDANHIALLGGSSADFKHPSVRAQMYVYDTLKGQLCADFEKAAGYPQTKLLGDTFSALKLNDDEIAATLLLCDQVAIWNHRSHKVTFVPAKGAMGIAAFGESYFVNGYDRGELYRLGRTPNSGMSLSSGRSMFFGNGRHIRAFRI